MTTRPSRRERCRRGRHTPRATGGTDALSDDGAIRRDTCRYCGQPIMRTHATRIWFLAATLGGAGAPQPLAQ